jgi:hypothetical protein
VLDVLLQHQCEVTWSGDQDVVEAFGRSVPIQRSAKAFARGARTGVRIMRMSAPLNTASWPRDGGASARIVGSRCVAEQKQSAEKPIEDQIEQA